MTPRFELVFGVRKRKELLAEKEWRWKVLILQCLEAEDLGGSRGREHPSHHLSGEGNSLILESLLCPIEESRLLGKGRGSQARAMDVRRDLLERSQSAE